MSKKISKAVKVLKKSFRKDEDYRNAWVANIAMSFVDAYNCRLQKTKKKTLSVEERHTVANEAADNFIKYLED
jgi:hypothetical protein